MKNCTKELDLQFRSVKNKNKYFLRIFNYNLLCQFVSMIKK